MRIVIPTKGRQGTQLTLSNLPRELHPQVLLVCPSNEERWLKFKKVDIAVQPDDGWTIARKRQWILEDLCKDQERIVMLDDDLRFSVRRKDEPGKFRKATPEQTIQAFTELAKVLTPQVPHAGFTARGGSISDKAKEGGWQMCKRMMYVLGYHVPTVLANVELGRIETREDMDVCLQLLTKGFPNAVNFSFVVDQKFGAAGGCTNERTMERSNADAELLASWFPQYVSVKEKEYTASIPRKEVVCRWQRAYEDSQRDA